MQRVFPTLRILDAEKSRDFYVEKLGFHVDWEWRPAPGLPLFMQISRDGLALYLSEHSGDCDVGGLVHLYVPDVERWYDEARDGGIELEHQLCDQPWGNREFRLRDPFGNCLCIASVLPRDA